MLFVPCGRVETFILSFLIPVITLIHVLFQPCLLAVENHITMSWSVFPLQTNAFSLGKQDREGGSWSWRANQAHPWQGFRHVGYCRQWRFRVKVLLLLRKICCFFFGAKQVLPQGKSPKVCNDSALSGQRAVLLQHRRLRWKEKLRKFYQRNSRGQPLSEQGSGAPFLDPFCCFWMLIPIPSLHLNLAEHEEWTRLCESHSPQGSSRIWGAWLIISA